MSDNEAVMKEVTERSKRWIESFNKGDTDACVAAYKEDAVMNAKPFRHVSRALMR